MKLAQNAQPELCLIEDRLNRGFTPVLFENFTKKREDRGWLKRVFEQNLACRVDLVRKLIALLVSIEACPLYVQESIEAAFNHKTNSVIEEVLYSRLS